MGPWFEADLDAMHFPFPVVEDPEGMDALSESGGGFLPSPGAAGLKEFKDGELDFVAETGRVDRTVWLIRVWSGGRSGSSADLPAGRRGGTGNRKALCQRGCQWSGQE